MGTIAKKEIAHKEIRGALLSILSWNSYGELSISIRGDVYTYYGIYEPLYERICKLLKHKNYSRVFKILARMSQVERNQTNPKVIEV